MSSALSIALSALQAQSEAIDTTGNNLANMNTTGFKGSMVDFEDLMSQYMGVGAGLAMGTGVARPINQQLFTEGPTNISASPLAAAIQGNGFFVVNDPSTGAQEFTRDGNFTISTNGELQTQTGENVQGWTAAANGTINTNTATGNIVLPAGTILPPQATQNFSLSANLNSNAIADKDAPFSQPITVYDSLGESHQVSVTFTQTSANNWQYQISIPGADIGNPATGFTGNTTNLNTAGPFLAGNGTQTFTFNIVGSATPVVATVNGGTPGLTEAQALSQLNSQLNSMGITASANPATGALEFTSQSAFTVKDSGGSSGTGVTSETGANQTSTSANLLTSGTLAFNADGTLASSDPNSIGLSVNGLADAANNLSINWNLRDSKGNPLITQYAQTSAASSAQADGSPAAQLTSVSIQSGGQVVAQYSNGKQTVEAQIALATIQNPDSLVNVGNNNFSATASTSAPVIGLPQTGGRGQILSGQLEGSNVDMATEFTNLITYQSAYQASSRVITTVDTMTQDLMNLIR